MRHSRPCPICKSSSSETLLKRRFSKLTDALLDGYNVVACQQCGFCFADQLPLQEEFDAYYEKQSKYEHAYRGGEQSEFDKRHRPSTARVISEWFPQKNARIVDIGCANGGLLAELRKQGYSNVTGVDPSPVCARVAHDLYGIEVATAPLSRIPREIGTFDLVLLGSVLEHVLDLSGTIEHIRNLLNPGGAVYLEVPDMTRCSLINDAPLQEFSVEHINYFGPISLRNLWQTRHFKTVSLRQTEMELVAGLVIFDIKALFQIADSDGTCGWTRDTETEPELRRYIAMANAKLEKVEHIIDSLAMSQQPIVVWGVGTHTQGLIATTRLKEANIKAFVDSNTRYVGQSINDIPVLSTDALKRLPMDILISSQQFQTEISDQIRNGLGLLNNIITLY